MRSRGNRRCTGVLTGRPITDRDLFAFRWVADPADYRPMDRTLRTRSLSSTRRRTATRRVSGLYRPMAIARHAASRSVRVMVRLAGRPMAERSPSLVPPTTPPDRTSTCCRSPAGSPEADQCSQGRRISRRSPNGRAIAFTIVALPRDNQRQPATPPRRSSPVMSVSSRAEFRSNDRGWLDPHGMITSGGSMFRRPARALYRRGS